MCLLLEIDSLETEGDTDRGPAQVEVREQRVALHVVIEIAVGAEHLAALRREADAERRLRRAIGVAGADVDVVRQEPAAGVAEGDLALHAEDRVETLVVDRARSRTDGTERRMQRCIERALDAESANAGE